MPDPDYISTPPLTRRRVRAILDALNEKLAGIIDDSSELTRHDYEAAREWAIARMMRAQLRNRRKRKPKEGD